MYDGNNHTASFLAGFVHSRAQSKIGKHLCSWHGEREVACSLEVDISKLVVVGVLLQFGGQHPLVSRIHGSCMFTHEMGQHCSLKAHTDTDAHTHML